MALIDPVCTCDPAVDVTGVGVVVFDPVCTADALVETAGSKGTVSFDAGGEIEALVEITGEFGDAPPEISVSVTGATSLRVTFSEAMADTAAVDDPSSYGISAVSANTIGVAVTSVAREAVTNPTYVDLTTTEHTDAGDYELSVAAGVVDQQGDYVEDVEAYVGEGAQPTIASAVAVNPNKIRVTFDEAMDRNDGELLVAANYAITPVTGGAASVNINLVSANGSTPEFVELETSEHTEGATYQVSVVTSGEIRDAAYNPIDPAGASTTYTGEGEAPTLLRVEAISSTRVDVVFSEVMLDTPAIRDPAQYVWDQGLSTVAVLELDGDTVKLVTTEQIEGTLYTLTIS